MLSGVFVMSGASVGLASRSFAQSFTLFGIRALTEGGTAERIRSKEFMFDLSVMLTRQDGLPDHNRVALGTRV
jgi:hypothetical protein